MQKLFMYQSGRVIALGRLMLAALFLLSIALDRSQPSQAPVQTYGFLALYLLFALVIAAVTWRNWWLDARLAMPTHLVDMAVFTAIVFSTNGYTSPFFLIFILPLLSAAIRWGWRETALTALALTLLHFAAGLLVSGSHTFELQRFVVRTGHLIILSTLLIWFGIHQRFPRLFVRFDEFDSGIAAHRDPLDQALRFAMDAVGARSGFLVLRPAGERDFAGLHIADGEATPLRLRRPLVAASSFDGALLFDLRVGGALTKTAHGRTLFMRAADIFDPQEVARLGLAEGLVADVAASTSSGWLVLQDVADLSTDYVELGRELGRAVGALIDRGSLLHAIEEGAATRTRLTLARDVHDSLVQFLAGASYRLEAIARAARKGDDVEPDLNELKGLVVEEQRDIRGFVTALRRDRELELSESIDQLRTLAARLANQWSVECSIRANGTDGAIPIRLQLDLQHLLREAVANAVRHGGASRVDVNVAVAGDQLRFDVHDNGSGFAPVNGSRPVEPWSLKERVDRAHGSLMLFSERGRTNISISLPLAGARA